MRIVAINLVYKLSTWPYYGVWGNWEETLRASLKCKLVYTCNLTKLNKRKTFKVYEDVILVHYYVLYTIHITWFNTSMYTIYVYLFLLYDFIMMYYLLFWTFWCLLIIFKLKFFSFVFFWKQLIKHTVVNFNTLAHSIVACCNIKFEIDNNLSCPITIICFEK